MSAEVVKKLLVQDGNFRQTRRVASESSRESDSIRCTGSRESMCRAVPQGVLGGRSGHTATQP